LGRERLIDAGPADHHLGGKLVVGQFLELRFERVLRDVLTLDFNLGRRAAGHRNADLRAEGRVGLEFQHQAAAAYRTASATNESVAVRPITSFWLSVGVLLIVT